MSWKVNSSGVQSCHTETEKAYTEHAGPEKFIDLNGWPHNAFVAARCLWQDHGVAAVYGLHVTSAHPSRFHGLPACSADRPKGRVDWHIAGAYAPAGALCRRRSLVQALVQAPMRHAGSGSSKRAALNRS